MQVDKLDIAVNRIFQVFGMFFLGFCSSQVLAHQPSSSMPQQLKAWLQGEASAALLPYEHPERTHFQWVPTPRAGLALNALPQAQREQLQAILQGVLSRQGVIKLDAIIATEAALGVLTQAPSFRDPEKYYTAVFGKPGSERWMLRFEGHHLSINLSFQGESLVSATPLFVGANPETISLGANKGLRALRSEVDIARQLYQSLSEKQRGLARGNSEGDSGFLTTAGSRYANIGKPAGIPLQQLNSAQQQQLKALIQSYVQMINKPWARQYLEDIWRAEQSSLQFFWQGKAEVGENFYYRINGKRLLIEMDAMAGATHIHAVWRDKHLDFYPQ